MSASFITRVQIRNYKSIAGCDVQLGSLTFLVGPNGSGKSNFLDSLRFLRDALRTSLDNALRERGGIKEVRRRSAGHPTHFGLRVEFQLPTGGTGYYAFEIGASRGEAYKVQREHCRITSTEGKVSYYKLEGKQVRSNVNNLPASVPDRLYLVNASGLEAFHPVYIALSHMGFYHLNPDVLKDLQAPDDGLLLARDGANLTSVVQRIQRHSDDRMDQIQEYLSKIVPDLHGIDVIQVGTKEILALRQRVAGAKHPWRFLGGSMSDGTLRSLGILVSLFQADDEVEVPLVGIEEPEMALHPAATAVLLDALREASNRTQVIITSHSPELLDDESINERQLLGVSAKDNNTLVGPVDKAARQALRDHLFTAGELLRLRQIAPDLDLFPSGRPTQGNLFS